jgi:predicted small metal-binding protein
VALVLRCRDLDVDPTCEYLVRNGSMVAILRQALDHVETQHGIFPIPRELEDRIHRSMQPDHEHAPIFARSS